MWCPGSDSNRHGFTRRILNPLRLPISPPGQALLTLLPEAGRCAGAIIHSHFRSTNSFCHLLNQLVKKSSTGSLGGDGDSGLHWSLRLFS